jgi:hypothetical protein
VGRREIRRTPNHRLSILSCWLIDHRPQSNLTSRTWCLATSARAPRYCPPAANCEAAEEQDNAPKTVYIKWVSRANRSSQSYSMPTRGATRSSPHADCSPLAGAWRRKERAIRKEEAKRSGNTIVMPVAVPGVFRLCKPCLPSDTALDTAQTSHLEKQGLCVRLNVKNQSSIMINSSKNKIKIKIINHDVVVRESVFRRKRFKHTSSRLSDSETFMRWRTRRTMVDINFLPRHEQR